MALYLLNATKISKEPRSHTELLLLMETAFIYVMINRNFCGLLKIKQVLQFCQLISFLCTGKFIGLGFFVGWGVKFKEKSK